MTNQIVLDRTSNLVMPSHYAELDRDEMSYVDGGASFKKKWWGIRIHLSRSEADNLGYALGVGYGAIGAFTSFIPGVISKVLSFAFFANATAIATALLDCNGKKGINIDFTWFHYAAFLQTGIAVQGILLASAIKKA